MLSCSNKFSEGEKRTAKRTMSYNKRYRLTGRFSLSEQRLAEFDCPIMAGCHPIVSPEAEAGLYFFVLFVKLST